MVKNIYDIMSGAQGGGNQAGGKVGGGGGGGGGYVKAFKKVSRSCGNCLETCTAPRSFLVTSA